MTEQRPQHLGNPVLADRTIDIPYHETPDQSPAERTLINIANLRFRLSNAAELGLTNRKVMRMRDALALQESVIAKTDNPELYYDTKTQRQTDHRGILEILIATRPNDLNREKWVIDLKHLKARMT